MKYTKKDIDKAKALSNINRLKIMEILSKEKSISLSNLIRKTSIKKTTLVFHLEKLKKADFIEIEKTKNTLHNPLIIRSKIHIF